MPKQRKPRNQNSGPGYNRPRPGQLHTMQQMPGHMNELDMLRRIPALETNGTISHQMIPHAYATSSNNLTQTQSLGAYLGPNISQVLGHCSQNGMIQLQAIPQQQQIQRVPVKPEISYKGMSRETFHDIVRARLENVAQNALNRTDGEREYQQKENLIKNRLRTAYENRNAKKNQVHGSVCSVGTSPTPSASIFHTPSPSPTFRSCLPDQIAQQMNRCVPPNIVIPQPSRAAAQLQGRHLTPHQIMAAAQNNNVGFKYGYNQNQNPFPLFDTPTQGRAYFMSGQSTPTYSEPGPSNFRFHQAASNLLGNGNGNLQIIQTHQLQPNPQLLGKNSIRVYIN